MTRDTVVIEPAERRAAVLRVIRGARRRLALTIFRCNDADVLDAVGAAVDRGVDVDVLLTRRARGWRRRLDRLRLRLERMGVRVTRHGAGTTKHHAKYTVADRGPLLVASFNLTRKCFSRTCDFGGADRGIPPPSPTPGGCSTPTSPASALPAPASPSVAAGHRPGSGGSGGARAARPPPAATSASSTTSSTTRG